jgi:uracil-DNA glycosylase
LTAFPDVSREVVQVATADAMLADVAQEARASRRCPLYRDATQVVLGAGDSRAKLFLVGEQPGDREDLAGRPFVGPAGAVLDEALEVAGIARETVYLTNAVKHFKHEQRGKRRLHKKPTRYEIEKCRWWLDRELQIIAPRLLVALGVTAATALAGRPVVLSRERGSPLTFADGHRGLVTIHPSAILRARSSEGRKALLLGLVADLRGAAALVR